MPFVHSFHLLNEFRHSLASVNLFSNPAVVAITFVAREIHEIESTSLRKVMLQYISYLHARMSTDVVNFWTWQITEYAESTVSTQLMRRQFAREDLDTCVHKVGVAPFLGLLHNGVHLIVQLVGVVLDQAC